MEIEPPGASSAGVAARLLLAEPRFRQAARRASRLSSIERAPYCTIVV
jgi:hypothetical protein